MPEIKIATRKSPLALWQAEYIADRIKSIMPECEVSLVKMSTQGDKILDTPLAKIGGKGLFVKELENGLLDGSADIAVHSMKDVPVYLPEGLHLPVILNRQSPLDAFVSNNYHNVDELPQGAVVGTASMRRQCQLMARRPDLQIRTLRGNVNTRLAKLDSGEFDAIILASAGLQRLGFDERITSMLESHESLPAIGQGALGIECRENDDFVNQLMAQLHDQDSADCVTAERALNRTLEGGCQVPIGGYAILENDEIWLRGLVGSPDGKQIVSGERRGHRSNAEAMGESLGKELLENGAKAILSAVYDQ